ncbi:MAG: PilZ domain-containing protein [Candidatus Methylomirabilales bacterium]
MSVETGERRHHLRSQVGKRLTGRIFSNRKASILDISLGGALIEHSNLVRLGTLSFLTVSGNGQEVTLRCRVIRSAIYRYEVRPTGDREHVYRTAVEFSVPSEDFRRLLHEITDLDQLEGHNQVFQEPG